MIDHQSLSGTMHKQMTIYSDTKLVLQVFILNQMFPSSFQLASKIRLEQNLSVYRQLSSLNPFLTIL